MVIGSLKRTNNKKLLHASRACLVGGVNSPVRSFLAVGTDPVVVKKGRGAYLYDHDGKRYIDYMLSWGAAILGHAHPSVTRTVQQTVRLGTHFGATTCAEIELAQVIVQAIPLAERVRFVNSGTEAVMGAVRLARGYTGRDLVLKFEGSYHGHADYLLAKAGSGLATFGIPASKGVPKAFTKNTLVVPAGEWAEVERIFKKHGKHLAAVLIEPVGGNYGVILPDPEFLQKLRWITKKYGALLIFDEVITGFRFHYGTAAELLNIKPDLITLGKIIGGGLPIGAFAGPEKIMRLLAPLGQVYQASTFGGNPVVMRAGLAVLQSLAQDRSQYARLNCLTKSLCQGFERVARDLGQDLRVTQFQSMFSFHFSSSEQFNRFFVGMLRQGVYFAPSPFEANFLSFAHTARHVAETLKAYRAIGKMRA